MLFTSRRAFIYVLEILAQVLALVTLARRLPPRWLAFIDNVAGQWAAQSMASWRPFGRRRRSANGVQGQRLRRCVARRPLNGRGVGLDFAVNEAGEPWGVSRLNRRGVVGGRAVQAAKGVPGAG